MSSPPPPALGTIGWLDLTIPDAEWLYNFSSVGTVVNVHY